MTQSAKLAVSLTALITAALGTAQAQTIVPVQFDSQGDVLEGQLFLPISYQPGDAVNVVIVTGAWTTVKEQMPNRYAAELASRGIAAFTFDFRGWGASEGEPRQLENPARKIDDIMAAAAYLNAQPEIAKVGGLGICASSGYMVAASIQSDAISTVGLVAPWLHDAAIVEAVYGGAEGVANLIALGQAAERQYAQTGEVQMITAASTTDESALMYGAPYYTEPDRGLIEAYDNRFNVASWEGWLTFDALEYATRLTTPLTFVHSEAAAIPQGAQAFKEAAGDQVQAIWLDDVTQFDFYDQAGPVAEASDAMAAHFNATF